MERKIIKEKSGEMKAIHSPMYYRRDERAVYSLRRSLFLLPLRRSLFGLFLLLLGLATRVGRITAGRNVTLLTILLLALTTSSTARFR